MSFLRICAVIGTAAAGFGALGGCKKEPDITPQVEQARKSRPPTQAEIASVFAKQGVSERRAERNWMKAHPDQIARVNAARAQSGQPPLGK